VSRPVTAAVVVTGDELLRGFVADANSSWIGSQLRALGIVPVGVELTGDGLASIEAALARAMAAHDPDLVIVSGGLGPTHDDRTAEAVASVWRRPLALDEVALGLVRERVAAFLRLRGSGDLAAYEAGNRKQATLPAGSVVVEPAGTAPAFVVPPRAGQGPRAVALVLPGPPSELRTSFRRALAAEPVRELLARVEPAHERVVRVWALEEY
jgi:nicotinamide-nucleotide amidase